MTGLRIVALADADSYLKWAATTLERLPAEWDTHVMVLRSPTAPSPDQRAAALAGTRFGPLTSGAGGGEGVVTDVTRWTLRRELERLAPDVLLLATTGPVAALVLRLVRRAGPRAPLVVTGLPGMSIPATELAVRLRAGVDLFVTHSAREQRDFAQIVERLGLGMRVVRARLPFLPEGHPVPSHPHPVRRVLFTPQARVPVAAADRERILLALDTLARQRPDIEVVVKLRALAGQAQTHREALPYDTLWARLEARGAVSPGSVSLRTGPLAPLLSPGAALVTVSSTAVLEALAARLPVLVLGDFGVDEANLTLAFEGSGMIGSLEDLAQARFFSPEPAWLEDNYFHDDDGLAPRLLEALSELRAARSTGTAGLGESDSPEVPPRARLRVAVRTGLPLGVLRRSGMVTRRVRRVRRKVRRWARRVRGERRRALLRQTA